MHPDTWKKIMAMIEYIKMYQLDTACSPSYQEIATHLGCNVSYITRLMRFAEARQLVRKPYGTRREIELM